VLVGVNGLILLLLGGAALGHGLRRREDPLVDSFGAVLALLFFGQLMAFLFPPIVRDYVGVGDLFRLLAYLVLLGNLFVLVISEVAERTLREERLRLSRELHDGLAQELGLLQFHLERAAAEAGPGDALARELDTARRLTESASLEARQAIVALRSGPVTWEAFLRALENFADEFSLNHRVEASLTAEGRSGDLTADLQAEVLRVTYEAFSNAVRHGGADVLRVAVRAVDGRVEVRIVDNGRGFDPAAVIPDADGGVGLQSMRERLDRRGGTLRIDGAPGRGVTIVAVLPLGTRRPPAHA
jgi:signal transduction histidine kinase